MDYRKKSLMEKRQEFKNQNLKGVVRDVSGENPVVNPYRDAPNIIVDNEPSKEWELGESMTVNVHTVKESYMFGERIEEENSSEKGESGNAWVVNVDVLGNELTSKNFRDESKAEDLAEFLDQKIDFGTVKVEKVR